jgi:hypothetical protein
VEATNKFKDFPLQMNDIGYGALRLLRALFVFTYIGFPVNRQFSAPLKMYKKVTK